MKEEALLHYNQKCDKLEEQLENKLTKDNLIDSLNEFYNWKDSEIELLDKIFPLDDDTWDKFTEGRYEILKDNLNYKFASLKN